ncbi:hypothetical protein O7614_06550 [Micromonospora sp. WMMD961]|uniref:hypothetical protein n=1 Tax=Micromonospora sp. WMMD961 TaxID=3016100 RepID=UPI0024171381|nr:hypothetical protein [Micromonospora sp. WMMD961]MDG4779305.1 hypothetical protein [Micromonospora sp. WMMD961]
MPETVAVQVGQTVVLDTDPMVPIAKVDAVQRYPVAVSDPDLRLRWWKAAVDQHQSKLAFLSAFRTGVGTWHEIASLTDPTETLVPRDLGPQLLGLAGTYAETEVQQRHHVHPTHRSREVDGTSGSGRAGHSGQQHRIAHGQHRLVGDHAPHVRDVLPGRHNHVHVGGARIAEAMELCASLEADDGGGWQPSKDRRQVCCQISRWRVDPPRQPVLAPLPLPVDHGVVVPHKSL